MKELPGEDILSYLNRVTEGKKPQTRRIRYAHLSAFFNFIRNNLDPNSRNPCDTPAMKRLFLNRAPCRWNTIDKDTVDEVIFKTVKTRNRLMLELMARGGMRIGEVLKLTPSDINERKLILREPKSGRVQESVFIPQKVSDRLKDHLKEKSFKPDERIFPICHEAASAMVKKPGDVVGVKLRPHDLRRHAATHASRSGVPVGRVIPLCLPSRDNWDCNRK